MEIIKRFNQKSNNLKGEKPVCIAFLGDSVTQGCFEPIEINETTAIAPVFDTESAYHTKLRKIFNMLYPNVPLNIINAGISGGNAREGLEHLDRDVLPFSPNLCVVCFGLNDCCQAIENALEVYKESLTGIFTQLKEKNIEVIFMTPNMMCTEPYYGATTPIYNQITEGLTKIQLEGRLDMFLSEAKKIANDMDIPVCDCYAKWKKLYESGVNVNRLLTGNHPIRNMDWMFAYSLVETMFDI